MTETVATRQERDRIEAFLDDLKAKGRRPNTVAAHRCDWRKVAAWSVEANGDPFDLARMVSREAAELRESSIRNGRAPATVNRLLAFLVEYTRWAATNDAVRLAPVEELRSIGKVPHQVLAPRGLTHPELRRYLKEVDVRGSVRDRAIIYLLLFTGLRLGEPATLRLEDLDLGERRGTVLVRSEVAKGGKERVVPVPSVARDVVGRYLNERGDEPGVIFLGQRGPLGGKGIAGVVQRYGRLAGIKLTPHTLRHCYAYRYLEATHNDLVGLAALLGHSSLNTTMGYFTTLPRTSMPVLRRRLPYLETWQRCGTKPRPRSGAP